MHSREIAEGPLLVEESFCASVCEQSSPLSTLAVCSGQQAESRSLPRQAARSQTLRRAGDRFLKD